MTTASPRGAQAPRAARLVACLLALVMLSGCAGWSARITIVPSHQAFDLDLIFAGRANQTGEQVKGYCDDFAKNGGDGKTTEHDGNVYCEMKVPVALKSDQTFVTHTKDRWEFRMTAQSLYTYLANHLGDGFKKQYPNGLARDEIDDFHMRVDFPDKVVEHNADSRVDGNSVIWDDVKPLFTDAGLQAASQTDQTWKWIVGIAVGLGAAAALTGLGFALSGWFGSRGRRRKPGDWPPEHVVTWWERNADQWRERVGRGHCDGSGDGPAR